MRAGGVANVILGVLSLGPRSGYEIKRLVDNSTRFFWAASYGQIYPELGRLASSGLIEGRSEPRGGRRRTVYRLTLAGKRALREWLRAAGAVYELRDERLLKLFFADQLDRDEARDIVTGMRRTHEYTLERLREVERSGKAEGYRRLVLEFGLEHHAWIADWCRRTEHRLADGLVPARAGRGDGAA